MEIAPQRSGTVFDPSKTYTADKWATVRAKKKRERKERYLRTLLNADIIRENGFPRRLPYEKTYDGKEDEEHGENDRGNVEGFFGSALFEFSEISRSGSEGKAVSFRLDNDRDREEDAYGNERIREEREHVSKKLIVLSGGKKRILIS
jgi:hypothetical protein